jgi:hypothetical protein
MNPIPDFDCDYILMLEFGPRIKFQFETRKEIKKIEKETKQKKKKRRKLTWAKLPTPGPAQLTFRPNLMPRACLGH